MSAIVVDCSVTASWCLRDESNAAADEILDGALDNELLVPALWPIEMANVLVAAERRERISCRDAEAALAALLKLPLRLMGADRALATRLLGTARAHGLSAYDAAYLELAMSEGVPLATIDRGLRTICQAVGVAVLPGSSGS